MSQLSESTRADEKREKRRRKKRIVKASVSAVAVILIVFLIVPYTVSAIVLHVIFDRRFETEDYLRFSVQDFAGLGAERCVFSSDGVQLTGYRYYSAERGAAPKGIIVLAHGFGGGGQNGYLDVSDYFVGRGYEVFAYDARGNDESGGKVGGLAQGVKDLNHALSFVAEFALPVFVWGHSWGGYSAACSLAFHEEVRAVALVSAFCRADDMIAAQGARYGAPKTFLPYVRSVERAKFGQYASLDGCDAAEKSGAGVFIAHGTADETVPLRYGYDAFYARLSDNPRVRFSLCEGKGHTDILYSAEGRAYTQSLAKAIGACPNADERQKIVGNLDRKRLCSRLNEALFREIGDFFDGYLTAGAGT